MNSSNTFFEIRRLVKELVRETILLPSQNFTSRIVRPDTEIQTRIKGTWRINALAVLGMKFLLADEEVGTDDISFWKVFSDTIEHSSTYTLLQQAKINILLLEEQLVAENLLNEDILGKTPEEIFGFLLNPSTKEQLSRYFRLYTLRPKNPKKVQYHRGYRDKGSLGGDKEFLKARDFDKDSKIQRMKEEYQKYQYSFKELEYEIYN
jgi:hypothetical protein